MHPLPLRLVPGRHDIYGYHIMIALIFLSSFHISRLSHLIYTVKMGNSQIEQRRPFPLLFMTGCHTRRIKRSKNNATGNFVFGR